MADPRTKGPQWKPPGTQVKTPEAKPKPPRDYIGPALKAAASINGNGKAHESIVAAIIIAQALDRFGEKLIGAAAVSNYKRTP